jgi:hypothetical protein
MNPKTRDIIYAGAEMVKNDTVTMPPSQSGKTIEATENFTAEEMEAVTKELTAKFEEDLNKAMILEGKSADNEEGKLTLEAMKRDMDDFIKAAINQTMFEKLPLADAEDKLRNILQSAVRPN